MHIESKVIDGVKYVEEKVFNDMFVQLGEEIDEMSKEIKSLKTEIYRLKHPEETARINSYLGIQN